MRVFPIGLFLGSLIAGVTPTVASAQTNTQVASSDFDLRTFKAPVTAPRERNDRLIPFADWPSDSPRPAFRNGPLDLGLFAYIGSTLQNPRRHLQEGIEARTRGLAGLSFRSNSIETR